MCAQVRRDHIHSINNIMLVISLVIKLMCRSRIIWNGNTIVRYGRNVQSFNGYCYTCSMYGTQLLGAGLMEDLEGLVMVE